MVCRIQKMTVTPSAMLRVVTEAYPTPKKMSVARIKDTMKAINATHSRSAAGSPTQAQAVLWVPLHQKDGVVVTEDGNQRGKDVHPLRRREQTLGQPDRTGAFCSIHDGRQQSNP